MAPSTSSSTGGKRGSSSKSSAAKSGKSAKHSDKSDKKESKGRVAVAADDSAHPPMFLPIEASSRDDYISSACDVLSEFLDQLRDDAERWFTSNVSGKQSAVDDFDSQVVEGLENVFDSLYEDEDVDDDGDDDDLEEVEGESEDDDGASFSGIDEEPDEDDLEDDDDEMSE